MKLRHSIFYNASELSREQRRELIEWALRTDDVETREHAIFWASRDMCPLSDSLLGKLDLTDHEEARLWLKHHTDETIQRLLDRPPGELLQPLLAHLADQMEGSLWGTNLRALLEKLTGLPRVRAALCLARWGQLTASELVELAESPAHTSHGTVLKALAELDPVAAEVTALKLLERHPRPALLCLAQLGSRRALEPCRKLAQRPSTPTDVLESCARYLDAVAENDEEMLETLLTRNRSRLPAARALITRGFSHYRQVFRLQLHSRDYDDCAEELLEWGSEEALEILLQTNKAENLLDEIEAYGSVSQRVRDVIPVARQRLKAGNSQ